VENRPHVDLLAETAAALVQSDEDRWRSIERGLAQADRGEFIEEAEMDIRVAKMMAG
jgi:predicted transcriptional regulator